MTVNTDPDESTQSSVTDWIATALAVVPFFAYILVIGFAPEVFARPAFDGSLLSVGLVSGVALTIFLVVLTGIYTYQRNKKLSP